MKDQNYYRKHDNGRYVAEGVCTNIDHLSDGLWLVKHHKYGYGANSINNIASLFRVGEAKEIDLTALCGMQDLVDRIEDSDEWNELIGPERRSYSLNDIAHICVKVLTDIAKEQQSKKEKLL